MERLAGHAVRRPGIVVLRVLLLAGVHEGLGEGAWISSGERAVGFHAFEEESIVAAEDETEVLDQFAKPFAEVACGNVRRGVFEEFTEVILTNELFSEVAAGDGHGSAGEVDDEEVGVLALAEFV